MSLWSQHLEPDTFCSVCGTPFSSWSDLECPKCPQPEVKYITRKYTIAGMIANRIGAESIKMNNTYGHKIKYIIQKTDGRLVDPEAEYFVLRLDRKAKDQNHVNACRKALMVYANEIEPFIPQLAKDLRARYENRN